MKRFSYPYRHLLFISIMYTFITACSDAIPFGGEEYYIPQKNQNSDGSGSTSPGEDIFSTPTSLSGKTLQISGQLLYLVFQSGTTCKVVPTGGSPIIITGTPTYSYKKVNEKSATLTFTYKDKSTISSSAYALSNTQYDLTLFFTTSGSGSVTGGWEVTTVAYTGFGGSAPKYSSGNVNGKSFTLK